MSVLFLLLPLLAAHLSNCGSLLLCAKMMVPLRTDENEEDLA